MENSFIFNIFLLRPRPFYSSSFFKFPCITCTKSHNNETSTKYTAEDCAAVKLIFQLGVLLPYTNTICIHTCTYFPSANFDLFSFLYLFIWLVKMIEGTSLFELELTPSYHCCSTKLDYHTSITLG